MIAYLEGVLTEKGPAWAIIEVGGVGYCVHLPVSCAQRLPEAGSKIRMLTHTYVREDSFTLYGFLTAEEKELFETLLKVNGIGPKSALGILSSGTAAEIYRFIMEEDLSQLTRISGIGKKTAQRLVVELKEKLQKKDLPLSKSPGLKHSDQNVQQALEALLSLGLEIQEAREALQKVLAGKKKWSAEELVKQALSGNARLARV